MSSSQNDPLSMQPRPTDAPATRVVPIDSVRQDPNNANEHNDENITVIKNSLIDFGQLVFLVLDRHGIIRKGNGTWQAAKQLGWDYITVIPTDLDGDNATAFALIDNRSAQLSKMSVTKIDEQLSHLVTKEWSVERLGFKEKDWGEGRQKKKKKDKPDNPDDECDNKPIYVTHGQRATLNEALKLVKSVMADEAPEMSDGAAIAFLAQEYTNAFNPRHYETGWDPSQN